MLSDAYWKHQLRERVHNERKKADHNGNGKDIGMHISKNLKSTEQCRKAAAKAT
jgi:hypothetical protein